jgi:agmatine/peptidylarginine deiminase/predicted amidohydrolase
MHFPAEWTQQSAILIAWPHAGTDWAARLHQVESTYIALARAVTRFEHLLICVADKALGAHVSALLDDAKVPMNRVHFAQISYDDTWLRDSGPITLRSPQGFALLDFRFTGWGGKYQSSSDDALVGELLSLGVFQSESTHQRIDFALEGGGIETDGQGTLLSTWHCLHERHPDLSREEVSALLQRHLHQDRVLWLDHGYLEGDDTDAHIDTLARFASPTRIVYQGCDDPLDSHFTPLQAMAHELRALRRTDGQPYECLALPWPKAAGVQLVLLQELHNGPYFCQHENVDEFDRAESIPGPSTQRLGALAAELKLVLVCSLFERRAAGLYHNTAVVFDRSAQIAGVYRKMHIPDDPAFYEKFYFTPGDLGFEPVQTSVGRLGVLVCWDQWYPEAARLMALAGADLLLYPTAIGWDPADDAAEKERQRDAWITVQRGHAVANGLPVLVANRTGFEAAPDGGRGIQFWGSSCRQSRAGWLSTPPFRTVGRRTGC